MIEVPCYYNSSIRICSQFLIENVLQPLQALLMLVGAHIQPIYHAGKMVYRLMVVQWGLVVTTTSNCCGQKKTDMHSLSVQSYSNAQISTRHFSGVE